MYRIKRMKALVVLMIIAMLFMFMPAGALAESFSDIAGHWAERHINSWLERGLASGYADGTFCPDNPVSRAEFAVFVSRAFPRSQAANGAQLSDLDAEAWYYPAVSSAVSAGIMSGYGDGTFRPGNPITRQEAASVLTRLLGLGAGAAEPTFTDAGEIAAWAKGAVDAVAAAGIMGGYQADGTFRPQRPITRAETIVILDRGLVHAAEKIPQVSVTVYDLPGTYGPETGSETITGNVTVGSPDVTLRNMIITGDLLLSEAIGDGDVTLKSVTVRGETIVKGGGAESIVLEDCTLPSITVSKEGVRVVASGNTTVNVVTLESGATLVEVTISGPGFETVTISEVVPAGAQITLSGDFEAVTVAAAGAQVEIAEGSVQTLTLEAEAEITGEGTIETAVINAEGATIAQQPTNVEVKEGVSASVGGKEVTGPPPTPPTTPPAGGGGGGGDTTPSVVPVSAISVEGDAVVGATLEAGDLKPTNATVKYQWQRAAAKDGGYVDIEGATGKTYKLVADDAGKWIKVKATGTGNYTGTVESKPVGPVLAASLSWARIDDAEITPDAIGFSDQKLTIDDAVVNSPIYIAIKAENEADEALAARNVIIGEDVNTDSFGVEVVKGYVYSNGSWEKVEDPPKIEYDDSNQYFYYNLNNFEGTIVQVIKLTPKAVNTFTIKVYMVSM